MHAARLDWAGEMDHKQTEQTPSVIDDKAERQSVFWGETAARLLVLPATTARFPILAAHSTHT